MNRDDAEAGFTLMETLAAVAAMGAIVAGLALITGQWLPTWRHGFADLQRAGSLGQGLDRLAADLAAAEYVRRDADAQGPLFLGGPQSVTFVRATLDPNAPPGLEVVRYAEKDLGEGLAMVRTRAPFRPGDLAPAFGAPVVVAKAPFRVAFSYAGDDRQWVDAWPAGPRLPNAVRMTVRSAGAPLAASTASLVHVTAAVALDGGGANAQRPQR